MNAISCENECEVVNLKDKNSSSENTQVVNSSDVDDIIKTGSGDLWFFSSMM